MAGKITTAEYTVMDILWREFPLAASEVIERLSQSETQQKDWSAQTVKTLLSRLVDKGVLRHERDGRRFLYSPLVSREAYASDATQSLADRLFGGRAAPLVAHLAENGGLEPDDIAELESILEELKRHDG